MGVVLAIDPGRRHGPALDRLTREFDTHEVVVAASGDEALAVLDGLLPDLILFPVFFAPGDETRLQARLDGLPSPQDRQALSIPLGAFLEGEALAVRPTAVPPRWFYWFKPQSLAQEMADPRAFASAVRTDVGRPRAVLPPAPQRVDPSLTIPPMAVPDDQPTPAAAMWSRKDDRDDAGTLETIESIAADEPIEVGEPRTARVAALVSALWSGLRVAGGTLARLGPALTAAFRLLRGTPRPVQVAVSAAAVVLTLGVTGQIGALTESSVRWTMAVRERWFPDKPPTGIAEIQTVPEGAQVWYQGRQLGVTPLRTELAVGTHEVELRYRSTTRAVTLDVTAGNTIVQRIEWAAPRVTGRLRIESDPSGAAVAVDGKPRGVTPLEVDDLIAGRHEVDVVMNGNTVRETVDVKGGKTATLRTSIYQGWLALFSPIDVKLVVNGRSLVLDDQQRAMLPSGSHQLTLTNPSLGYEHTQTVDIKPGDTTPVSVVLPKTTLSVATSSPADVWVDGERIGEAPIADHPVDIGTRSVLVRSAEHGERHVTVTATVDPARVSIDFATSAP